MKATKQSLLLAAIALLALAGTAVAAGTVSVTLTPNKAGKASTLHVVASGFSSSSLPKSVALFSQRGFKADPRAVAVKCTNASSCPSKSQIGSGQAMVHVSAPPLVNTDVNVPLTLYLGKPTQSGDLASVILTGSGNFPVVGPQQLTTTGRLFKLKSGPYGLELLFDKFNSPMVPPGVTATLTKLDLTAGAKRTVKKGPKGHKHKVRYTLIRNPKACTGSWSGKFIATFQSGPDLSFTTSAPCKK